MLPEVAAPTSVLTASGLYDSSTSASMLVPEAFELVDRRKLDIRETWLVDEISEVEPSGTAEGRLKRTCPRSECHEPRRRNETSSICTGSVKIEKDADNGEEGSSRGVERACTPLVCTKRER